MPKYGPIESPVEMIPGNPNEHKGGDGKYNGVPNYPGRTAGGDQLPEKTLDSCGEFSNAGKGQG